MEIKRGMKNDGLESWTEEEEFASKWKGVCFGKGSAPEPPTKTQVTQTSLPDYAEPYFEDLMSRGEEESLKDYVGVPGQRIADLNADEFKAFNLTRDNIGDWRTGLDQVGRTAALGQGYAPGGIRDISTEGQIASAEQYLNQYVENSLNVAQRRSERRFDEAQLGRDTAATNAGAFGNSRRFVENEIARGNLGEELAGTEAQILNDAQNRAFQLAADETQAGISRDISAGQLAGDFGRLGLEAGSLGQELGFADANALQQVGAINRDLEQQRLDLQTADFISERDFGRQQIGWLGSLLHGIPVSPQSEVTTFQARNPTAELLGLGLGAAGISKLFR